jgi:hypothetical protein
MKDSLPIENFEFIGFTPAESVAEQASEEFRRLYSEAPSDAAARAYVRRTWNGYEGRLQIRSAAGTFVADADIVGDDPASVIGQLAGKVRAQLNSWKERRYLRPEFA